MASAASQELSREDFENLTAMIRAETGIVLGPTKRQLVQGRLARRLRACQCADMNEYLTLIEGPHGEAERLQMINALTTNLTGFFREAHHFEYLRETILPELAAGPPKPGRRLRIWSAGCSSGEEPYTIAMVLWLTLRDLPFWDALILATDIDTNMVAQGAAGRYTHDRIVGIPPEIRGRFLRRSEDGRALMREELRDIIRFRRLNLLDDWPMGGRFDVIFCRNVMIYFDKDTQRRLCERFADMLTPGGHLFIGHSETMNRVCDRFEPVGRTIYRRLS